MQIHQIRRMLFLGFVAQEGVICLRATPQERKHAPVPVYQALLGLCRLAPLVLRLRLPRWLDRLALRLQVLGWTLPVPPSMAAMILTYRAFRRVISQERAHLAALQIRHRGLERRLWSESEA